jgi:chromosomal replication initiator protein
MNPPADNTAARASPDPVPRGTYRARIAGIQQLVAVHFGVPRASMTSTCRRRAVVRPRQVAMYLARELTPYSLPEIARAFHKSKHTTIVHALRTVEALIIIDPDFAATVAYLRALAATPENAA